MSLPGLTAFAEQIGSIFEVIDISSPFDLKLNCLMEHSKTETSEAFSIFFLGTVDHFMPQGTHRLRHAHFGEIDIFLVPVAKTNSGFEYEAAFNYILSK